MSTIYRGFEIVKAPDGLFEWKNAAGNWVGGFKTEKEAMDDIDAPTSVADLLSRYAPKPNPN